jgi:hypothetical protein
MMYPHPIIAKEGWLYLVVIGVLAFIVHRIGGLFWSWPLWVFFIITHEPLTSMCCFVFCVGAGTGNFRLVLVLGPGPWPWNT